MDHTPGSRSRPWLSRVLAGIALAVAACGPSVAGVTDSDASTSEGSSAGSGPSSSGTTQMATTATGMVVTGTAADGGSTTVDTTAADTTAAPTCMPQCRGQTDCNDGMDNDGDGVADLDDPDCISPCHFDESTPYHDILDVAGYCIEDCYFDDNTGQGDDDCVYDPRCDPLGPLEWFGCDPMPDAPSCQNAPSPSDVCQDFCLPMVPPGCDCFGCCTFPTPRGPEDRSLSDPSCTMADPTTCPPCTQNTECVNLCDDPCEWCFGETEPPAGCAEATCEHGSSCTDHCDCPDGSACLQGCCRPVST